MTFEEIKKDCKYRTYQDNKCVHDKNPKRVLVGSCEFGKCPRKVELLKKKPEAGKNAQEQTQTGKTPL